MWTSWSSNFSLTFSSYGLEIKLCLASSSTIVNYYYFIRLLLPIWLFLLDLFAVCVCVCLFGKSCLTLCNPMDCSPPGSSVHGISQENGKLPLPSTRNLPHPDSEIEPVSPALMGRFFTSKPPAAAAAAKSLQSCPTLCEPKDGSPTRLPRPWDSSGKTLEWVAISFSSAWKWKWSLSVVSNS